VSLDRDLYDLDESELGSLGAILGHLDDAFERTGDRAILRRALEDLTPRQKDILRLLFYEDLSQAEIGERLNISQMQVSRLRRDALLRLRNGIQESGHGD
jgi:RNA polymerase sigma-B factor